MKPQVNSANTPQPKGSCSMEKSTWINWNSSWVPCLVIPLVSCFQLCTGNGVLGRCLQMICISEQTHYCKCGQLATVGHVLKECSRSDCEGFTECQSLILIYCYILQVSLNRWNYSWRIQCHWTIELILRADTATLPVLQKQMFLKFKSSLYADNQFIVLASNSYK